MTCETIFLHEAHDVSPLKVLLAEAHKLYADICDALERVSPEDNEYCLLLSNAADDLDSFISGIQRLGEAPHEPRVWRQPATPAD
jgi:hypothetical protein